MSEYVVVADWSRVDIEHCTAKALCLSFPVGAAGFTERIVWLPRRFVRWHGGEYENENRGGDEIAVPRWLAIDRGLV
jgi:hypothetical protein